MNRLLLLSLCTLMCVSILRAQTPDSLQHDSVGAVLDSASLTADSIGNVNNTDTATTETRREKRQRERQEREAAEQQEPVVFKDSARLAIEELNRKAWKRSLIIPGWGQYTNGGLWWIKVPVIYGGFVSAIIIFDYWQWYYKKFGDEAAYRIDNNGAVNDPDFARIQQLDFLIRQKDYGRRNRDLTILATVGWWGLNVVEAYTTSILKYRYDMGDDLTLKVTPTAVPMTHQLGFVTARGNAFVPGIRLTMNIK